MKHLMIMLLVFISMNIFAENVDIKLLASSGECFTRSVDTTTTSIVFSKMDISGHSIASIENLNVLQNLNSIEFYNLPSIYDYSFLCDLKNLEFLHFGGCTISDLSFLKDMKNLKYLYLNICFPDDRKYYKNITKIDFSAMKKIEVIVYSPCFYTGVPKFYNVQNRPYLDITNNQISELSIEERILLGQYSLVSLYFNPIAKRMKPIEELNNKILYDSSVGLPDYILDYFK